MIVVNAWLPIAPAGGGGISFVGSGTFVAVGDLAIGPTFNFSSLLDAAGATPSIAANDFAIINYCTGSGVDRAFTPPAGYTELIEHNTPFSIDTNQCIFYKLLDGSETSVVLPASGNANDAVAGQVFVFRGVNTVTPFDVAHTTATGTATGRPNPAAITPTTAGAWIVVAGGSGNVSSAIVFTNPDLSATANHFRTVGQSDGNPCIAGTGIKTDWASGSFDPGAWGGGSVNANDSWAAVTMALRPA